MNCIKKTKAQLLQEVIDLRQQVADLKMQRTTSAEAHLRGECIHEARLGAIIESAADGIITIDERGHIESFNPAAERLFGYREAEVIGQNVAVLLSSPYRKKHHSYLRRYLQTGDKRIIGMGRETLGQRRDGSGFPIELTVSEGRLGNRRVFTGIARDLSEHKRMEAELRRTEHLALLGRLAASVSHELRNPLTAISLHMDIVEEELQQLSPDNQVQISESVAEVKGELTRMYELVEDYLSLARLTSMRRQQADLGTFVQACAQEKEEQWASHGIALFLCGLARLGEVAFHPNTLRRALANLMQNALEAMPEGGRLSIRGRRTALEIQLQICDTGVGIPEAELPLIFEPLHTTKPDGTGLGLYLVQEIVAAHEGHIDVHSVLGEGTTFTITLPRAGKAPCKAL